MPEADNKKTFEERIAGALGNFDNFVKNTGVNTDLAGAYKKYLGELKPGEKVEEFTKFAANNIDKYGKEAVDQATEAYKNYAPDSVKNLVGKTKEQIEKLTSADEKSEGEEKGEDGKPKKKGGLGGNMMGIGGLVLGGILAAAMGGGLIGILIAALVGLFLGSALGDGESGFLGGLFEPKEEKNKGDGNNINGPAQEKTQETKLETGRVQVLNKDGTPISKEEQMFQIAGDDGKQLSHAVKGKVEGTSFVVTEVASALKDGTVGPFTKLEKPIDLQIGSDGKFDSSAPQLNDARKLASDKAAEYAKEKPLDVKFDGNNISASYGKTTVNGKEYEVVLHGTAKDGKAFFTTATLVDDKGKEIIAPNGEAIIKEVNSGAGLAFKEGSKVEVMEGRVKENLPQYASEILAKRDTKVKEHEAFKQNETKALVGKIKEAESAEAAYTPLQAKLIKGFESQGANDFAALTAANAVIDKYKDPKFRKLSPEDAATELSTLNPIKNLGLKAENTSINAGPAVIEFTKNNHNAIAGALNEKAPASNGQGANVASAEIQNIPKLKIPGTEGLTLSSSTR